VEEDTMMNIQLQEVIVGKIRMRFLTFMCLRLLMENLCLMGCNISVIIMALAKPAPHTTHALLQIIYTHVSEDIGQLKKEVSMHLLEKSSVQSCLPLPMLS
jgi:hypothetical protein